MSVNIRDVSCIADILILLQRIKLHVNSLKLSLKLIKNTIFSISNSFKHNTSTSNVKKPYIRKKAALKNIFKKIKTVSVLLIIAEVFKNNSSTESETETDIKSNIE